MAFKINMSYFKKVLFVLVILIMLAFFLFPVIYVVLTSFKSKVDLLSYPPRIFFKPTLDYWIGVLRNSDFLFYYKNSFIISSLSVLAVIVIASFGAYSLSRFQIKRKEDIAFWILSQSMTPVVAVILPLYILFSTWGIKDTYQGIILAYTAFNLPFAVWFLRNFFNEIPIEISEAAIVDGCTKFKAFYLIDLPLVKPGLVATAIYTFIMCLNEFFVAFILTGSRVPPATVALTFYLPTDVRGTMYGEAAVAGIMIMFIPIIFFAFVQKYFVAGLIKGSIQ